jgi:hypothetical protein
LQGAKSISSDAKYLFCAQAPAAGHEKTKYQVLEFLNFVVELLQFNR